jgi:hypothetical protein
MLWMIAMSMLAYARELEHLQATKRIFLPVNLAGFTQLSATRIELSTGWNRPTKHSRGSDIRLWQIKLYPALVPLQSDPRFKDSVYRIGLPV